MKRTRLADRAPSMLKVFRLDLQSLVLASMFIVTGLSAATVSDLRCENLVDPLGIDVAKPRLSWIIESSRSNEKQSAYEIVVDDQWDSGRMESDQSINVEYGGKDLAPASRYSWKVRVWDADGQPSDWSQPAVFSTGLKDWSAKWIGYEGQEFSQPAAAIGTTVQEDARRVPARYLRKEFDVTKKVSRATAYVCGLGFFNLFLNGEKVSNDMMDPALSDFAKADYYVTFDVTDQLKQGTNAVGVVLGNGRYFAPRIKLPIKGLGYGYPKLLLQLDVEYSDGTKTTVISDESWRLTTNGPIRSNNEYDGEEYDARMEMPGWNAAGFDDSKWQPADLVAAPGGALVAQMIQPMRVTQVMHPVGITNPAPGTYIVDMGQTFYGTVRLKASGPAGTQVRMTSAYALKPDGTLKTADNRTALSTDVYTLKGQGLEVWNPVFKGQGYRRVQVTGFPGTPTVDNFEGLVIHTDAEPVGEFQCSNDLINRIHRALWWGMPMFLRSVPLDPDRTERMPWMGDPAKDAESQAFNWNVEPFYAKWMDDVERSQKRDGTLPSVSMYIKGKSGVEWPAVFTIIPDWFLDFYGDRSVAEKHYAAMKTWVLAMMQKNALPDGTLKGISYGDWCDTYTMDGKVSDYGATPLDLISTAYEYNNCRIMERLAKLMGKTDDETTFVGIADKLKTAFNQRFFNPDTHVYLGDTQCGYVLALQFGLVADDQRAAVIANLVNDIMVKHNGHLSVGLIGMQWLMQTLSNIGRPDVAWTLATQTTRPSWGYMLSQGSTTIWERWDYDTRGPGMNSEALLIQAGNLDAWFYQTLAGIEEAAPGFQKILIKPSVVGDLTWVKAHFDSPYGRIVSNWKIDGAVLTMDVTIPANTTATVVVPGKNGGSHEVGSGHYRFTAQLTGGT
jgi:alpha-L-rhamnosidase